MTTTRRIDVSDAGAQANNGGSTPGISADGRYIAYLSKASNLVAGDTNNTQDVFVYDRVARTVVRVSVKPDGSQGLPPHLADFGGEGLRPALSADGRFVAFFSFLELVPGDTNVQTDIYVHDRDADEDGIFDEAGATDTDRVSVASDGSQATPYSNYYTDISADGRYVTFASDCNNLVVGDTNGRRDVFVHDRDADADGNFDEPGAIATRMVSIAADGTTPGNEESTLPRMSADGRYISFIGGASNLVSDDLNGRWDAFIRDRDVDQDGIMDEPGEVSTVRASIPPGGGEFNVNVTYAHDLSSDGTWFAFEAPDAPSGAAHIQLFAYDVQSGGPAQFIRDLGTVSTIREMAVNGDGSSIVTNVGSAVTLVDRVTTAAEAISTSGGSPAPGTGPAISDDARFVAFGSDSQLIPGDTNGQSDVFLRDRNAPPLALPTAPSDVVATAGDGSASLSWTAPDDGGSPIQHYYVTPIPPDVDPFYVNAPSLATTIPGLTPGRTYTFTVSAITAVGTGPAGTSNPVTPTGTQRFALQVAVSGNGTVQSSPAGIDCGATCSFDFDDGQQVTLEAMPDMGSTFEGWGGACSGWDSCQVTMDQARQVTATFEDLPPLFPGFSDDFDGTALDSAKWNTTIATSGMRWCPTTQANHLTVSGLWQDVSSVTCNTALAPAPHGSISVAGGTATLSAGSRATFPYIWRGRQSGSSPFPSTGAFVLEVRMRFPSLAGFGTELNVGDWPNTDPVGDNPPGNSIFSIGACGGCGLVTNMLGATATVAGPNAFHDYRLEYVNGRYSLWVDEVRTMGPVGSPRRPDSLWVGNPVMTFWGTTDWTDIALDSARVLVQRYPLTVSTDGTGAGVVTSDPAGIDCGSGCQQFDADTEVTLTATPNGASAFTGWSGGGCSGTGTCVVTMDQARNVTATFGGATRTLTVTRDGNGDGAVTSDPAGIDCPPMCSATYHDGSQITLRVLPGAGSAFEGWAGGACSGRGLCTVVMNQAASVTATFALVPTGQISAWGYGFSGQLGTGAAEFRTVPTQLAMPANVVAIDAGQVHSLALTSDGRVWAWGTNHHGELGLGGFTGGLRPDELSPILVPGLSNIIAISAGTFVNLALTSDGRVWSWGHNGWGGLGVGGNDIYSSPQLVPAVVGGMSVHDVVAIAAGGQRSIVLRSDGTVMQFGPGVNQVSINQVVAIAAGMQHFLALKADGTVWAWGANHQGQIGSGSTNQWQNTPVQVVGLDNVERISAGATHSLASTADGRVWAWGDNTYGQLGDGTTDPMQSTPVQVLDVSNVEQLAGGLNFSLAVADDGTLLSWGNNALGQLGSGSTQPRLGADAVLTLGDVDIVSAGGVHGLALATTVSPIGEEIGGTPGPGEPASTDVEGDGATSADPVETQVTTPNGGVVSIQDGPSDSSPAVGYAAIGTQMVITAPPASADEPIEIVFELDSSRIPLGFTAATLGVFRNGSLVLACNPDPPRVANPDPCVESRTTLADGDARIVVLTSQASLWQLGLPAPVADAGGPYTVHEGFTVVLDGSGSTGSYPLSFQWATGGVLEDPTSANPAFLGDDDAITQVDLIVSDATGGSSTDDATIETTNVDPSVAPFSLAPLTVGQTLNVSASFTDPGTFDTHTAEIDWGDGTTSAGAVTEQGGSGSVAGAHVYAHTGTYQVKVSVTDDDGGSGERLSAPFSVSSALPTINIGAVPPVIERNSGATTVRIPVTLSAAGTQPIDVRWSTGGGTASPGSDYVSASGTLHWNAGSGSAKQITLSIRGDVVDEPNQTFIVTLSAPVNATISTAASTVTIADDDPAPRIVISDALQREGASGTSQMTFVVLLDRRSESPVTVSFGTVEGTAKAGVDYLSRSGVLTFAPGITSLPLAITIIGDRVREGNERFTVRLTGPTNSTLLRGTATATILNDD